MWRSPVRDIRGAVAIYIAFVAPVLLGVGALTLDLGRLITLNTELQSAADAAALAGARELNRTNCGASSVKDALASTAGTCVGLERATTKTGVDLQMVRTGINVRFD